MEFTLILLSRLNTIAQDIDYITENDETLEDPSLPEPFTPADIFIDDVLTGETILIPEDDDYIDVNNIEERKIRLTENNLIFSTSFAYKKDKRKNIFDNDFSIFQMAG